jgi:hypothetical protein
MNSPVSVLNFVHRCNSLLAFAIYELTAVLLQDESVPEWMNSPVSVLNFVHRCNSLLAFAIYEPIAVLLQGEYCKDFPLLISSCREYNPQLLAEPMDYVMYSIGANVAHSAWRFS